MTTKTLTRFSPLLLVLLAVLFPFQWLAEHWTSFGTVLSTMIPGERAHTVAHAGLFFTLGLVAVNTFPRLGRRPLWFFLLVLVAAVSQETFQLLYKDALLSFDTVRDMTADLAGGAAALGALWAMQQMGFTCPVKRRIWGD